MKAGDSYHKFAAYANDLLFCIADTLTSLPSFLMKQYVSLSNFKVNLQKSEALNVSLPVMVVASLRRHFPFKYATQFIQYLGTKILVNLNSVFSLKFQPILAALSH